MERVSHQAKIGDGGAGHGAGWPEPVQVLSSFGAAVASWWAGENLIDVAPYINDARELKLVLLGGRTGAEVEGHDWEYLLNALGVAHKDHEIAAVVQVIGILTMIAALVWGVLVVWNQIGMMRRSRSTGP